MGVEFGNGEEALFDVGDGGVGAGEVDDAGDVGFEGFFAFAGGLWGFGVGGGGGGFAFEVEERA